MSFNSIKFRIVALSTVCVAIANGALVGYSAFSAKQSSHFVAYIVESLLDRTSKESLERLAADQAGIVRDEIQTAFGAARGMAYSFETVAAEQGGSEATIRRTQLNNILLRVLKANLRLNGTYSAWAPNSLDGRDEDFVDHKEVGSDQTGRALPYWTRDASGKIALQPLVEYDSAELHPNGVMKGGWFLGPQKTGEESILAPLPYIVQGKAVYLATISVPIMINGKFAGVAGADFNLAFVQTLAEKVNGSIYGGKGSVTIVSNAGLVIADSHNPGTIGGLFSTANKDASKYMDILRDGKAKALVDEESATLKVFSPLALGRTKDTWSLMITEPRAVVMADANALSGALASRQETDVTGQIIAALIVADAAILAMCGVVIDVTNRKEAEDNLAHAARHDPLTGLPNRVLFSERMSKALALSRRGEQFAVLCLDLDRFKEVNDTLGHSFGDRLLRDVTERLKMEMREFDTLARLGGDEFAIIQSDLENPQDASTLARRLIEALSAPFLIDGHQVVVGVSVGIAVTPGDGAQKDELLKAADMALYQAKAEGRGCWRYFKPEMNARMQERRALELDLRRAYAENEFELFYQPILDVATRRVKSLEALIRWRHPVRGLVAPDAFIPLCEEIGLIVPLGAWILRRACEDAMTWPGRLSVAVNLSAVQFLSGNLLGAVVQALGQSGLPPDRLEIEITETAMMQDTEATLAILHSLKRLGLRISMDDFGTGYSSLSYLQRFPFDKVKIDRSFTRNLGRSRQSNAIVQAVADLCVGLDMTTIAEGVETEEQFQSLVDRGCSEAQGFLFSAPRPLSEIAPLIERLGYEGETRVAAE